MNLWLRFAAWTVFILFLMAFTGLAELYAVYLWFIINPWFAAALASLIITALLLGMWYKVTSLLIAEISNGRSSN